MRSGIPHRDTSKQDGLHLYGTGSRKAVETKMGLCLRSLGCDKSINLHRRKVVHFWLIAWKKGSAVLKQAMQGQSWWTYFRSHSRCLHCRKYPRSAIRSSMSFSRRLLSQSEYWQLVASWPIQASINSAELQSTRSLSFSPYFSKRIKSWSVYPHGEYTQISRWSPINR